MEINEILFFSLLSAFVVVFPVFIIISLVKLIFRDSFIIRKEKSLVKLFTLFPQRIDKYIHELLVAKFPYYTSLSSSERIRFYVRLRLFIESKRFKPCQILEVTQEMKILIGASAVQLTFGLDKFIFHHFKTILVYPKAFLYSDRNYHKGNVNVKGSISISFEDFVKGYADPTDSYNLGLHEMAHALELEYNLKDEYDAFFGAYYERWLKSAATELVRMNYGQSDFLRKYAGRNVKEFFSVCAENFFERPILMKEKLPEIYRHMTLLLNQDPASGKFSNQVRSRMGQNRAIPSGPYVFLAKPLYLQTFLPNISGLFIFLLLSIWAKEVMLVLILVIPWLAIFVFTVFNLKYFYIYPGSLVVRPFLERILKLRVYNLENVVSVSFPNENKRIIKISHINEGRVVYDSHAILCGDEKLRELISLLKSSKVMVKFSR
ncbi:MAG TPA: zinc-dependent peptidase [Bacteroidales bacterium]|nr:zinc-dependent peptidase [Bacteroidales bacterium]